MTEQEMLSRWRLILGSETQDSFSGMGGGPLSAEQLSMDAALAAIYGGPGEGLGSDGGRGAGKGPSSPLKRLFFSHICIRFLEKLSQMRLPL